MREEARVLSVPTTEGTFEAATAIILEPIASSLFVCRILFLSVGIMVV